MTFGFDFRSSLPIRSPSFGRFLALIMTVMEKTSPLSILRGAGRF